MLIGGHGKKPIENQMQTTMRLETLSASLLNPSKTRQDVDLRIISLTE